MRRTPLLFAVVVATSALLATEAVAEKPRRSLPQPGPGAPDVSALTPPPPPESPPPAGGDDDVDDIDDDVDAADDATTAQKPGRSPKTAKVKAKPKGVRFSGPGRFAVPSSAGDIGSFLRDTRGLIRPVYEVRGLMLQTRLLMLSSSMPVSERKAIAPWLDADAADVGFVASLMNDLDDADTDERQRIMSSATSSLASAKQARALERSLKGLAAIPALRPEAPLSIDPLMVAAIASDASMVKDVEKIGDRMKAAVEGFAKIPAGAPKALQAGQGVLKKANADAQKASKGNNKATASLIANGIIAAMYLPELGRDLVALPGVIADIATEATQLVTLTATLKDQGGAAAAAATTLGASLLALDTALPATEALVDLGQLLAPGAKPAKKKKPAKSKPKKASSSSSKKKKKK